jgi:uncharacterized protein (TIGR00255 family)
MTGFGRARIAQEGLEVVVEVRAVNHRFLDVNLRVPRTYSSFEPQLRKMVGAWANRGKIEISVTRAGSGGMVKGVVVDLKLAECYHECLQELKQRFGLAGEITLADMLTLKDVIVPVENEEEIDKESRQVVQCLEEALASFDSMRRVEGDSLWHDIEARLHSVREMAGQVKPLAGLAPQAAKERLERRVQELMANSELSEDRLAQEVALIADKADITEELIRIESHVEQFLGLGRQGSPLGRKLEFLLQELHREISTIGSKSASTDISAYVISMKAEVEKVREQIQNIE